MTTAIIMLVNAKRMGDFYFTKDAPALAASLLQNNEYDEVATIEVDLVGKDAAEEMFDLTNNPGRQFEREDQYGRGRSVSVGDIIRVDGVCFLCSPMGWKQL